MSELKPKPPRRPKQPTTTAIRVLGEIWRVPRGFGRAYACAAKADLALVLAAKPKPGKSIGRIRDLLALIGYEATIDQVIEWDLRTRVEAVVYAATEHARASDNPVRRHPKPSWLPKAPWCGPWYADNGYIPAGPSGTPIPAEAAS